MIVVKKPLTGTHHNTAINIINCYAEQFFKYHTSLSLDSRNICCVSAKYEHNQKINSFFLITIISWVRMLSRPPFSAFPNKILFS